MTDVHKIWSADEYAVEVTVTKSKDGVPLDLTGAVVQASAISSLGAVAVANSVTVTDAVNGKLTAVWNAGSLQSGLWTVEVRVTPVSDGPQTVAQYALRVARSQFVV